MLDGIKGLTASRKATVLIAVLVYIGSLQATGKLPAKLAVIAAGAVSLAWFFAHAYEVARTASVAEEEPEEEPEEEVKK